MSSARCCCVLDEACTSPNPLCPGQRLLATDGGLGDDDPFQEVPGQTLQHLSGRVHPYEEWVERCSAGISLLLEQSEHAGPCGDFDGVSIVSYKPAGQASRVVELVQWLHSQEGIKGRVANLDEEKRVKAIVPVGSRRVPIDFSELTLASNIIYRDTGARSVKAKWKVNQAQSQMPDRLLSLLDMFRLAEGAMSSETAVDGGPLHCFICNSVQPRQLPLEPALRCSLCLLPSHRQCVPEILQGLEGAKQRRQARLMQSSLPTPESDTESQCFQVPLSAPSDFAWPAAFRAPGRRAIVE